MFQVLVEGFVTVGSLESETATFTLADEYAIVTKLRPAMSIMEANHLPLDASYITFGSERKSEPVLKNRDRVKFWIEWPCFVKNSP